MQSKIIYPEDKKTDRYVHKEEVPDMGFAIYQDQGPRLYQQDAMTWSVLNDFHEDLTPVEIGKRLWTSYQYSHLFSYKGEAFKNEGSAAITTVYDGQSNLITATVGDCSAFVVIYDDTDEPLIVYRLNSVTHKPKDEDEQEWIVNAGGFVRNNRVNGLLAMSRAIGDWHLSQFLRTDAQIDIININELIKDCDKNIGRILVISATDGFTDGADLQTLEGHEKYVKEALSSIDSSFLPPLKLAEHLVSYAYKKRVEDNCLVAIQEIQLQNAPPFLLGVYDGHGSSAVATYLAQNFCKDFQMLCELDPEDYALDSLSTDSKKEDYERDNPPSDSEDFRAEQGYSI